jgi:hypothetical protein
MIHAVRVLNVCGWLINLMLKTRKNVSVEKCKQIIEKAEQGREVEIHKPTISHYWDKENGMNTKTKANGLILADYKKIVSLLDAKAKRYGLTLKAFNKGIQLSRKGSILHIWESQNNYSSLYSSVNGYLDFYKEYKENPSKRANCAIPVKANTDLDESLLKRMSIAKLTSEYKQAQKDAFGLHGHNAKRYSDKIVRELLKRGVQDYPSMFGMSDFELFYPTAKDIEMFPHLYRKHKNPKFKETGSGKEHESNIVAKYDVGAGISMTTFLQNILPFIKVGEVVRLHWKGKDYLWIKTGVQSWSKVVSNAVNNKENGKNIKSYGVTLREEYKGYIIKRDRQGNYTIYKDKVGKSNIVWNSTSVYYAKQWIDRQSKENYADFDFDFDAQFNKLSKMFQGKVSGERKNVLASDLQPDKTVRGGSLSKLIINGLNGKKYQIDSFGSDAWFSFDRRKNLWLSGKDARLNLKANGIKISDKQMHCLGYLEQINYITRKNHIEKGELVEYYHKLGEVNGAKPTIWVDADGFFIIIGGDYDIWKEGIVN